MPELPIAQLRKSPELGVFHDPMVPGDRGSGQREHFPGMMSLSASEQNSVMRVSRNEVSETFVLSQGFLYHFEHNPGGGYKVRQISMSSTSPAPQPAQRAPDPATPFHDERVRHLAIAWCVPALVAIIVTGILLYRVGTLQSEMGGQSTDIAAIPARVFEYADSQKNRLARTSDIAVQPAVDNTLDAKAKAIVQQSRDTKGFLHQTDEKAVASVLVILRGGVRSTK
jgi:hypothetical protein